MPELAACPTGPAATGRARSDRDGRRTGGPPAHRALRRRVRRSVGGARARADARRAAARLPRAHARRAAAHRRRRVVRAVRERAGRAAGRRRRAAPPSTGRSVATRRAAGVGRTAPSVPSPQAGRTARACSRAVAATASYSNPAPRSPSAVVGLLPPAAPGPGRAASVPTAALAAVGARPSAAGLRADLIDRGASPDEAGTVVRMLRGVDRRAQVGVLTVDAWGALRRSPEVLEVLDGPRGRYLVIRSADGWTTVAPTDARRLRHRVAEPAGVDQDDQSRSPWRMSCRPDSVIEPGQRRVDRERVRQVLDGEAVLHRHRDRQDQLARPRRDDHPADDHAGRRAAEQLHEAVAQALHLGARRSWPAAA